MDTPSVQSPHRKTSISTRGSNYSQYLKPTAIIKDSLSKQSPIRFSMQQISEGKTRNRSTTKVTQLSPINSYANGPPDSHKKLIERRKRNKYLSPQKVVNQMLSDYNQDLQQTDPTEQQFWKTANKKHRLRKPDKEFKTLAIKTFGMGSATLDTSSQHTRGTTDQTTANEYRLTLSTQETTKREGNQWLNMSRNQGTAAGPTRKKIEYLDEVRLGTSPVQSPMRPVHNQTRGGRKSFIAPNLIETLGAKINKNVQSLGFSDLHKHDQISSRIMNRTFNSLQTSPQHVLSPLRSIRKNSRVSGAGQTDTAFQAHKANILREVNYSRFRTSDQCQQKTPQVIEVKEVDSPEPEKTPQGETSSTSIALSAQRYDFMANLKKEEHPNNPVELYSQDECEKVYLKVYKNFFGIGDSNKKRKKPMTWTKPLANSKNQNSPSVKDTFIERDYKFKSRRQISEVSEISSIQPQSPIRVQDKDFRASFVSLAKGSQISDGSISIFDHHVKDSTDWKGGARVTGTFDGHTILNNGQTILVRDSQIKQSTFADQQVDIPSMVKRLREKTIYKKNIMQSPRTRALKVPHSLLLNTQDSGCKSSVHDVTSAENSLSSLSNDLDQDSIGTDQLFKKKKDKGYNRDPYPLFIGQPPDHRVAEMGNYVDQVEKLIGFHELAKQGVLDTQDPKDFFTMMKNINEMIRNARFKRRKTIAEIEAKHGSIKNFYKHLMKVKRETKKLARRELKALEQEKLMKEAAKQTKQEVLEEKMKLDRWHRNFEKQQRIAKIEGGEAKISELLKERGFDLGLSEDEVMGGLAMIEDEKAVEAQKVEKEIKEVQERIENAIQAIEEAHEQRVREREESTKMKTDSNQVEGRSKSQEVSSKSLGSQLDAEAAEMQQVLNKLKEKYQHGNLDTLMSDRKPRKHHKIAQSVKNELQGLTRKGSIRINKPGELDTDSEEDQEIPQAVQQFSDECKAYGQKIPSVFKSLQKGELNVSEIILSSGQVNALAIAAKHLNKHVNIVKLDNNNLKDDHVGTIIESMSANGQFQGVSVKRNAIGERTLDAIKGILNRPNPSQFQNLVLDQCKINPQVTAELVDSLKQMSTLRKLSLVQANLSDKLFHDLVNYVKQQTTLQELDLRHNRVRSRTFKKMLDALANHSTSFVTVYLAHNSLVDAKLTRQGELMTMNAQEIEVLTFLGTFIKRNKALMHLDLSYTGLTYPLIIELFKYIYKSKSLQAIHLCNNPGTQEDTLYNQAVKIFGDWNQKLSMDQTMDSRYEQRLFAQNQSGKAMKSTFINRLQSKLSSTKTSNRTSNQNSAQRTPPRAQSKMSTKSIQEFQEELNQKTLQSKIAKIKDHSQGPVYATKHDDNIQIIGDRRFILQRQLGHKKDIPGSQHWKIYNQSTPTNKCWICDNWVYTVIFWSRDFGKRDKPKLTSRETLEYQERHRAMETYSESQTAQFKSRPFFSGSWNNFQVPVQMLPLKDYVSAIDQKKPEYVEELVKKRKIRGDSTVFNKLRPLDKITYKKGLPEYIARYEPELWKSTLIKTMKYRKPNLVNVFQFEIHLQPQIFIGATFVKPGFHRYVVSDLRAPADKLQSVHNLQAEARYEKIPPYIRLTKQSQKASFDIKLSVFAKWERETAETYRQCIEHDLKFWKAHRFIKDPQDYQLVADLCFRYATELCHMFQHLAARSVFPAIGWLDFTQFAVDSGVVDSNFKVNNIDRQFIAATTGNAEFQEIRKQKSLDGQLKKDELLRLFPDNALIRFMFLELLLRVAGNKYRVGIDDYYSDAFRKLLENDIFPNFRPVKQESFRLSSLWKTDISNLFKQNDDQLKRLYKHFHFSKKFMAFEDAQKMVDSAPLDGTGLGMSIKDFSYCYAMSKLTVTKEMDKSSDYFRMKYLEFIEFIARVSESKFLNTSIEGLPLTKKIEIVLDELLKFPNAKRHEGPLEDESSESGESEDSY